VAGERYAFRIEVVGKAVFNVIGDVCAAFTVEEPDLGLVVDVLDRIQDRFPRIAPFRLIELVLLCLLLFGSILDSFSRTCQSPRRPNRSPSHPAVAASMNNLFCLARLP